MHRFRPVVFLILALQQPVSLWADSSQAIGGGAGVRAGLGTAVGGLKLHGEYLYRLSEKDWFDGRGIFSVGSRSAVCFFDRSVEQVCEPGVFSGVGVGVDLGIRRWLSVRGALRPYVRVGTGISWNRFSEDNISGLVVPLWLGAGVVRKLAGVSFTFDAQLGMQAGRFQELGFELGAHLDFSVGILFEGL